MLLVDDEPDLRSLLDFNFRAAGFETALAANGEEALRLATQRVPDLVLLDLMLPDLPGTEVCKRLKSDPRTRDVPVIMLTIVEERNLGYALGAAEYLVKPLDRDRLVEVIRRHRPERPILVVDDEPEQIGRASCRERVSIAV